MTTRTSTYNTRVISLHQHHSLSRRTLIRNYTYAAARSQRPGRTTGVGRRHVHTARRPDMS